MDATDIWWRAHTTSRLGKYILRASIGASPVWNCKLSKRLQLAGFAQSVNWFESHTANLGLPHILENGKLEGGVTSFDSIVSRHGDVQRRRDQPASCVEYTRKVLGFVPWW